MESGSRSSGRRVKLALRSLSNVGIILREIFKIGMRVVDYFGKILYSFRGGEILLLANLVSMALMHARNAKNVRRPRNKGKISS